MPKKKKNLGVNRSKKIKKSETIPAGSVPSTEDRAMLQMPHGTKKEELISSLSEIFSDLDPTVIYMVLSECDFQVEDTMDYLLELSTAAKEITSEVSGFDSISASLVGENQPCSETEGQSSAAVKTVNSSMESEKPLSSEELFFFLHNSLGEHNADSEIKDSENVHISGNLSQALYCSSSDCVKESSEHAESSLGYNVMHSSQKMETDSERLESIFTPTNPDYYESSKVICRKSGIQTKDNLLGEVDIFAPVPENYSLPAVVLDSGAVPEGITMANVEMSGTDSSQTHSVFLDLTTISGIPTQLYQGLAEYETNALDCFSSWDTENQKHAMNAHHSPKNATVPDLCAGSSLKLTPFTNVEPFQQTWTSEFSMFQKHLQEPFFYPEFYSQATSQNFVTPVAISPGKWTPDSDFSNLGGISSPQAFSQSWENNSVPEILGNKNGSQKMNFCQVHQLPSCQAVKRKTPFVGHVLVLLRGVPGSGKSYLARALLEDNPDGIILSTDDYFYQKNGEYQFDADCLSEAHEWNRKRAKEAFEKRITPIIIDNTNTQAWEMKPYVALSQQHKYKVILREPDTWWKFKPKELERRNIHGVSKEKIKKMLERYQHCLTVNSILNSSIPDELKSATCDEVLHQKKEQGKDSINSHGKNEELFRLQHMDDKHLSEKAAVENQNLQEKKHDTGYNLREYNSESRVPQNDLDIYTSPGKDKIDSAFETEVIKTNTTILREKAFPDFCVSENIQACSNSDLKAQVLLETESAEEQIMDVGDSTSDKSIKPEVLNFVGDWPVEQTMGQRVKRARRLEKLMKNHKEDKDTSMPTFDSLKIPRKGEKMEPNDTLKEMVLSKNKEDGNHQTAASMSSIYTDKDTSGLLVVGDWPVQNSLEQRQHRLKRVPKKHLSELEGIGSSQCDTDINIMSTMAGLSGTSGSTDNKESFQMSDTSVSDIAHEKKAVQNKRIRKHHKLALTFTNNVALSKPEEQSTLFNVLEEKSDKGIMRETSRYSQTEPQDFALLWRLERKIIVSQDTKVLHGRIDGFIPKDVDATSDSPEKIPYKVTYEKSTYVEESELVSVDESEKLNILCKLFGSFSFDALKDLYERCNRDIDWATGILLDSDEKLCKDDDIECLQKGVAQPPGMSLTSKENTSCEGAVANFEETQQETASVTSAITPDSEIMGNSVDNGRHKMTGTSKENAEIPNLLTNVLLAPSEINRNSNQTLPETLVEKSDKEAPFLDCMEKKTKEMYSVTLSENEQQNVPLHTEMNVCVPVMVPNDFNGNFSTLNPTVDMVTGNTSSEEHQECSTIKNTPVQELLSDLTQIENLENNGDWFEQHKEMEPKPLFLKEAENKQNKMLNQNDDITKLLNPMPASNRVNIDCLELTLPPELAIQLSEIFGPVGVDSGSLTSEDYVVHIDLNLAREIHEKWKASIMKRQKREEELNKLLEENPILFEQLQLDELDSVLCQHENSQAQKSEKTSIGESAGHTVAPDIFPFMDHWNVQTQKVSLREIMSEEMALQEKQDLKCFPFMARKDCAARLKEKQLLEMFPTINPNFLMDMFKDNNYSLEQTVQFLNTVLEADPVKTVVAKETAQGAILSSYGALKKRAKKIKEPEDILSENAFQDFEYPGYSDFRAEAFLHQQRRQESLRKAGEAYRIGMKPVAAFYVQQGRLHEQKMKEANHAAALQIFEKVNASKLPENLLDLHGLHVDEALNHLGRVLQEKTEEYSLAGGKPYLYVITGRGNHSQGGVARIKPAVMKYLTNHKFRFTEEKPGCLKVMLK